jgi:hypothetical protein
MTVALSSGRQNSLIWIIDELSWETELGVADSPPNRIYFNGRRFFGPYETWRHWSTGSHHLSFTPHRATLPPRVITFL